MRDDFGIRGSANGMAASHQFSAQIEVVVNLTVQNNLNLAIFAGNRLLAASHVNNTQAPDGQPDAIGYEEPFLIRATMHDRIGHALKGAPDFRTGHPWIDYARYSAHMVFGSALYRCAPLSSLCAISWL